jgi:large subunit ribosomal protein L21
MFAVIKTGGKQYRVAAGDRLQIELIAGAAGDIVTFSDVLLLENGGKVEVGAPNVAGASVAAEILGSARGPKVIAFKKRRRKNSRRKRGHRQDYLLVQITEILTGGAKPSKTGSAKASSGSASESVSDAPAAKAPLAAAAADSGAGNAGVAAAAAAAVAAAKAAGIDTSKFSKLDKPVGAADDLKLIGGVGPIIEKKLNAIGIWHFWQVRAMSDDDIASVEAEVGFKGRASRDEWKAQAGELMDGKGPRAKVDQAAAKKQ